MFECATNGNGTPARWLYYRPGFDRSDSSQTIVFNSYEIKNELKKRYNISGSENWNLAISNVQLSDAGMFVCELLRYELKKSAELIVGELFIRDCYLGHIFFVLSPHILRLKYVMYITSTRNKLPPVL